MEILTFIKNYREAFGETAELPIVFWFSDKAAGTTEKINRCFLKGLKQVRNGETISLNAEAIGCGGGKLYTGFAGMPERVPEFVSLKERYKQTPEMVRSFVEELNIPKAEKEYLNFARINSMDNFGGVEGLLFLATPDILSGLVTWAYFDNNSKDAVVSLFGSGCCAIVTQAVKENRMGGKSTFIGLFDPSVRPWFEPDILSYVIPITRFGEMYHTMRSSCMFDTHAWSKIRERISSEKTP